MLMDEKINFNLAQASTWKRIFFMLIFLAIDSVVRMLLMLVIFVQVATVLFSGTPNTNILNFGRSLSTYTYHIFLFLTFNTETLPFPFSDWNITAELDLPATDIRKEG